MRGWGDLKGLDLTDLDPVVEERFWAKIEPRGKCEVWVGRDGKAKQRSPQFSIPGVGVFSANQVAYALFHNGIQPPGLILRKQCETDRCVSHWEAMTTKEARRSIQRSITDVPVDEIRAMRQAGAKCGELAHVYDPLKHQRVRDVFMNKTYHDPGYVAPPVGTRREEHPELFRISDELLAEIVEERNFGTSISRIHKWSGVPLTTIWEALNGPSTIRRRT